MKLKEVERTAVQAWSPASHHPIHLATGTSAQQLDASFSTSATLDIFEVDFRDPSLEMKCRGSLPTSNRFHKLIWGSFANGGSDSFGVIAGGRDNGAITLYDATLSLTSAKEPVIAQVEKHTGPVRALDFNPFQDNLLASGANNSEIYIWDLNNFNIPMTPGTKSQPPEDISVVAWNQQVQHILSSAHPSGKAVVWDLRKSEPVIQISDHSNRMCCSGMAWHPEIATQLVLSSEDDRLPVIQIWDLRFATSPLSQLEGHTRGILALSWCQADPDLLLTSAKDSRILCWNLCTSEVVFELHTQTQWCFDVQWCPRNPSVFSAASFNGWLNVYSVMGGSLEAQQKTQADKISSSFSHLDPFDTGQSLLPLQVPERVAQTSLIPPLKKPPRWIRRPTGASFAFGGKLITFGRSKAFSQPGQQTGPQQVFISQVTTEADFLARSRQLLQALESGSLLDFCQKKIKAAQEPSEENVWNFLKVNLESECRTKRLRLLGYNKEDLQKKIALYLENDVLDKQPLPEADDLVQTTQAILGLKSSTDKAGSTTHFFDNILPKEKTMLEIPVSTDTDGLISQALLLGDFPSAVELCVRADRFADALILAISGGEKLLQETQKKYFAQKKTKISPLLSTIVLQSWQDIICTCNLQSWKEALAILLMYSTPKEYTELCDLLGARLESEGGGTLSNEACLCYISSGNAERLVECWVKIHRTLPPLALQGLMEKVMVLTRSMEMLGGTPGLPPGPLLAEQMVRYASLLASQGCLAAAMSYLPSTPSQPLMEQLQDRLCHAQGKSAAEQQPSPIAQGHARAGAPQHQYPASKGGSAPEEPISKTGPRHLAQGASQLPITPPALARPPVPSPYTPPPAPVMPLPSATPATPAFPPRGAPPPYFRYSSGVVPTSVTGPAVPLAQPFSLPGANLSGPSRPLAPSLSLGPTFLTPASVPCSQLSAAGGPATQGQSAMLFSPFPLSCPAAVSYPPGGPVVPTSKPLAASNLPSPPTAQESWNSPALRGSLQRKRISERFTPPTPITTPVRNLPVEPPGGLPGQFSPSQEFVRVPPGTPTEGGTLLHQLPVVQIKKKEIPPEHQVLKTTFERLVQRCLSIATDVKTRRKLEDATQRLECLYEKLQEQALSQPILLGLHEMARCAEARSYQQALAVHTQVVSSSSFSDVSGFMPVLKAILTVAQKLSV
ncbi:protein transport protein Sec31B [Eublepharis macularius]|uniref:Protein transport protein Sec31A n=1 Tax=Eublepharis macularius TaxID=481883 RepID=A0AA97JMZ2_EUBMA|nr:protein transport protein Sec31B [Eublepharis macularius]